MKYYAVLLFALPLCAQQLVKVSGDGLVAIGWGGRITERLLVRAVDAAGRPMPNVPIAWDATPRNIAGNLVTTDTVTDANGLAGTDFIGAAVPTGTAFVQWKIIATASFGSATFTASTVGQQPNFRIIIPNTVSGPAGSTASEPIVGVLQSSGFQVQGIPNAGLRVVVDPVEGQQGPTASCGGPAGVALTNNLGRAECYLVFGPVTGTGSATAYFAGIALQRFIFTVGPAQDCRITLGSTSQGFGPTGGSGSFDLQGTNDCFWTAVPSESWITITSPANARGSGPGRVAFTLTANTANTERTGFITVGGQTFTIRQSAVGGEQPLSITIGPVLPQAAPGVDYAVTLTATGGRPPYTWTENGVLPANLSLNRTSGVLSGRPPAAGSFPLSVTVRDAAGRTATRALTLNVSSTPIGGANLAFSTAAQLPPASLQAEYSQTVRASGGCESPFRSTQVTLESGVLPPGLSGQSAQGGGYLIIGTPTQTGSYSFTLRADDACGNSTTRTFTLSVGSTSGPAGGLVASTTAVAFRMQRGQAVPAEQSLTLSGSATALPFQIAVTSDANWLDVSPRNGQTNATVQVRVINGALAAGRYSGTITVTGDPTTTPLTIPATLDVVEPLAINVTPSALQFEYTPGSTSFLGTQLLSVSPAPGVTTALPFTAEAVTREGGPWLTINSRVGTAPATIVVSVNPVGLAPGAYSGTVAIQPAFNAPPVFVPITLTVTGATPLVNSIVNGASFTGSTVAPGEIITIFGAGMGPAVLQGLKLTPAGTVDTNVSDVRVWFDDQPAPLIYVSSTQISAIVPYGIGGRTTTRLSVEYRGIRSPVREVPVVETAPAIFTLSGGSGQAAALNEDTTVNTAQNGARRGSIITLYATGEGQTSPLSIEGSITRPDTLPKPVRPVQVTVGGVTADVLYAGSAPGQVAGLMQVNVRVPEIVEPGAAVPVVLTVGSTTSPAGVTVAIRP